MAEKVDRARQTVVELDTAIRQFRKDTGRWPDSLEELVKHPGASRSATANRPYVTEIPSDPWGQRYRYEPRGQFNPDAFDVYSVHGNSRNPSLWIGNWPNPFRIQGALEGEQLKVKVKSDGVSISDQKVDIASLPPLSGGRLLFVRLRQKGDSIDLALPPSVKPGRYILRVRLVTSWDYAVIRMSFNNIPLGQPVDTYTPVIDTKSVVLGTVDVNTKATTLRLESMARNPESTGYYAGIDAVMLTPVE